jgi:hydrogenase small subunit
MASGDAGSRTSIARPGISRRAFLKATAALTAVLALPASYAPRVAAAIEASPRIPVVWLHGIGCGGETEAFLRAADPTVTELLLDVLDVRYDAALMAATGSAAMDALEQAEAASPGGYFLVVEGAIPTAADGTYAALGGQAFRDVLRKASEGAIGTLALGSCAFDGGIARAGGSQTGATGVAGIVGSDALVTLPGCPVNVENLTATIVHYVTFGELPPRDPAGRPYFAYGGLLHNQCERRAHFEFGEFVLAWGDEGAQKGWCLYKMGCKGPETYANCPTVRYGEGTSWNVRAGHGCVGCTMPGSWDAMSPFYRRLPAPLPIAPHVTTDQLGLALVAGLAGVTAVHGTASYVRSRRAGRGHGPEVATATAGASTGTSAPEADGARVADAGPGPGAGEQSAMPEMEPSAMPDSEETAEADTSTGPVTNAAAGPERSPGDPGPDPEAPR